MTIRFDGSTVLQHSEDPEGNVKTESYDIGGGVLAVRKRNWQDKLAGTSIDTEYVDIGREIIDGQLGQPYSLGGTLVEDGILELTSRPAPGIGFSKERYFMSKTPIVLDGDTFSARVYFQNRVTDSPSQVGAHAIGLALHNSFDPTPIDDLVTCNYVHDPQLGTAQYQMVVYQDFPATIDQQNDSQAVPSSGGLRLDKVGNTWRVFRLGGGGPNDWIQVGADRVYDLDGPFFLSVYSLWQLLQSGYCEFFDLEIPTGSFKWGLDAPAGDYPEVLYQQLSLGAPGVVADMAAATGSWDPTAEGEIKFGTDPWFPFTDLADLTSLGDVPVDNGIIQLKTIHQNDNDQSEFEFLEIEPTTITPEAALPFSEVEVTLISNPSIKVEITKVGAGAAGVMVGYRERKTKNGLPLTLTAVYPPILGTEIEITGLTAGKVYEVIPYSVDGAGKWNQPGPVLLVVCQVNNESARDIAEAMQALFRTEFNAQIDAVAARKGDGPYTHFEDKAIEDVDQEVRPDSPLMRIVGTEAIKDKVGDRNIWEYTFLVDISVTSENLESDVLQRRVENYMEAAEAVLDQNDTIGDTVWEAEVTQITYPPLEGEGEDDQLTQAGVLHVRVHQTN
jgi:hypothetical protein